MTSATLEICRLLPKVELHAHLNGSVSQNTLAKLYNRHPKKHELSFTQNDIMLTDQASYEDAFKIFRMLHSLVVDIECLKIITNDVIEEFYSDMVLYLELRSTPKTLEKSSKRDYIETIVNCIQSSMKKNNDLYVTYLVSIDRGRSIEDAQENLTLAVEYSKIYPDIVVGVEVSGNPSKGDIKDFIPILDQVKQYGLKLIVHVGEVENEAENLSLLQLCPDRVGHAVFIHPRHGGSDALHDSLANEDIPIEVCLSSNVIGGIVKTLNDHPIKLWYETKHPLVLCTDDKGLFGSALSDEYYKAVQLLKLTVEDLWKLSEDAIEHISASVDIKEKLRALWKNNKEKFKAEFNV